MKRKRAIVAFGTILALWLVAGGQSPSPPAPAADGLGSKSHDGHETLVDTLRQMGVSVQVNGRQDALYVPGAARKAQRMARLTSSLAHAQVDIVSFEPATWVDSCLGAELPEEACAEAIRPGWIVTLRDQHGEFVIHTDLLGERMRRGPAPLTPGDDAGAEPVPTAPPADRQSPSIPYLPLFKRSSELGQGGRGGFINWGLACNT